MNYPVTCPDPECGHEFEVAEDYLDLDSDESEPILCPSCEQEWCWEFDEDQTPPLRLTELDLDDDIDDDPEDDGFEEEEC